LKSSGGVSRHDSEELALPLASIDEGAGVMMKWRYHSAAVKRRRQANFIDMFVAKAAVAA
jgi:hypothetical protein